MEKFSGFPSWYEDDVARLKGSAYHLGPDPTIQSNLITFSLGTSRRRNSGKSWVGRQVSLTHRHSGVYRYDDGSYQRMRELDQLIKADPEPPEFLVSATKHEVSMAIIERAETNLDQCASVSLQGSRCRRPRERGTLCGIHHAKLFGHEWGSRIVLGTLECGLCGAKSFAKVYTEDCPKKIEVGGTA